MHNAFFSNDLCAPKRRAARTSLSSTMWPHLVDAVQLLRGSFNGWREQEILSTDSAGWTTFLHWAELPSNLSIAQVRWLYWLL